MINHKLKNGISEITLDNPRNHNAFSDLLIKEFNKVLEETDNNKDSNFIVIKASGVNFSSGADLNWMRSMAKNSKAVNKKEALLLANFLYRLNSLSKPVIALVQGQVFGGAIGVLACCDIVIAERDAQFCFSEVKLGLIPATIAPYILQAIGHSVTRQLFITAEPFDAQAAQQYGLIHKICPEGELEATANTLLEHLRKNGPNAMATVKSLLNELQPIDKKWINTTSQRLADTRVSDEAQEGMQAFFDKRPPAWTQS
jgi:methylglutaconyl-CoA hydratase